MPEKHIDTASERPGILRWIVVLLGLVLLVLGVLNIAAEIKFSMAGQREAATIVATDGGIGRKNSVDARATVALRDASPISVDLHDTLNSAHWKEGDKVEVLCAHIHAGYLTCVGDLWFDRWAFPVIMAIVGALLLLGAWRLSHPRVNPPK